MKAVILAAGKGTRLFPLTKVISKVLLPVYDKPMIYYSLELLRDLGVTEFLIVVSDSNKDMIEAQLGNGEDFGVKISYEIQKEQKGTASAFMEARKFLDGEGCALLYADNIFLCKDLDRIKTEVENNIREGYSSIFTYTVEDPQRFGVLETDKDGLVVSFEEKPEHPKSNLISTGLFFYDHTIFEKVDRIELSPRGEYEMAAVNEMYLREGKLKAVTLDGSAKWYDAGTAEALLQASCDAKDFI